MIGLSLQENWKFRDIKENIEALVTEYNGLLSPFSCFEIKEKNNLIRILKKQVFDYKNILDWQRERLWETLNCDFDIKNFKKLQ